MRRDPAVCAGMSDPARNREFRRGWLEPPWPYADSRTRRPCQGASASGTEVSGNVCDIKATLTADQARAEAERLLRPRVSL